jgi:Uma2 family endonuclease
MATVFQPPPPNEWAIAVVQQLLGFIPAERIRTFPAPGAATEKDVVELDSRFNWHFELIDGVLVEKTTGYIESLLAVEIAFALKTFVEVNDLGIILGEGGTLKILPNQIRVPDVCFIAWRSLPGRKIPRISAPSLVPDLAVEVISASNSPEEMRRKLGDYFAVGVRMVWYVDPTLRSVRSYSSPDDFVELRNEDVLSGGEVLPGFQLPLKTLFAKMDLLA